MGRGIGDNINIPFPVEPPDIPPPPIDDIDSPEEEEKTSSAVSNETIRYDTIDDSYETIPDSITSRIGHFAGSNAITGSSGSAGNPRIYVFGGYSGDASDDNALLSSCESMDIVNQTWAYTVDIPTPRAFGMSLTVGNRIYCIGGVESDIATGMFSVSRKIEYFDTTKEIWNETLAPMPEDYGVAWGNAQYANDFIYVTCGVVSLATNSVPGELNPKILRYSVSADEWDIITPTNEFLYKRLSPFGWLRTRNNRYFIFSGSIPKTPEQIRSEKEKKTNKALSDFRAWINHSDYIKGLSVIGQTGYIEQEENRIKNSIEVPAYYYPLTGFKFEPGSEYMSGDSLEMDISDTLDDEWAILPKSRDEGQAVYLAAQDTVFMIGGSNQNNSTTLNRNESIDLSTSLYDRNEPMSRGRSKFAAIPVGSDIYILGGMTSGHAPGYVQINLEHYPKLILATGNQSDGFLVTLTNDSGELVTGNVRLAVRGKIYIDDIQSVLNQKITKNSVDRILQSLSSISDSALAALTDEEVLALISEGQDKILDPNSDEYQINSAKKLNEEISIFPILYSTTDFTISNGVGGFVLKPRSEDPLADFEKLAKFIQMILDDTLPSEDETFRGDLSREYLAALGDTLSKVDLPPIHIDSGSLRNLYQIETSVTVVSNDLFGQTVSDLEEESLAAIRQAIEQELIRRRNEAKGEANSYTGLNSNQVNSDNESGQKNSTYSKLPQSVTFKDQLPTATSFFYNSVDWVPQVRKYLAGNNNTVQEAIDQINIIDHETPFGSSQLYNALFEIARISTGQETDWKIDKTSSGTLTTTVNKSINIGGKAIGGTSPYTYVWSQTSGPSVEYTSTEGNLSVTFVEEGVYTFHLDITDSVGDSVTCYHPLLDDSCDFTIWVKESQSDDIPSEDFVDVKKTIYIASDNTPNLSLVTRDEAIDEVQSIDGERKVPIIYNVISTSFPATISAQMQRTDKTDIQKMCVETGGQSTILVSSAFLNQIVNFAIGAIGGLGYGIYTRKLEFEETTAITLITFDFDLPDNTNGIVRFRYSANGYSYSSWSEKYEGSQSTSVDIFAKSLEFEVTLITGFTLGEDEEYDTISTGIPRLNSIGIETSEEKVDYIYLDSETVNKNVQQIAVAVEGYVPESAFIEVGVSPSESHHWSDFESDAKPSVREHGKIFLLDRSDDSLSSVPSEYLQSDDGLLWKTVYGAWDPSASVTLKKVADGIESIVSSGFRTYPRNGEIYFDTKQPIADNVKYILEVENGSKMRVGLRIRNKLHTDSVTVSGVGYIYSTNDNKPNDLVQIPPTATDLAISPAEPKADDTFFAFYNYFDPNNDKESGTSIKWYKNSFELVEISGLSSWSNDNLLSKNRLQPGDSITFSVTPSDGIDYGATATSPSVVVQSRAPTVDSAVIVPKKIDGNGNYQIYNSYDSSSVLFLEYDFESLDIGTTAREEETRIRWFVGGTMVKEGTYSYADGADSESLRLTSEHSNPGFLAHPINATVYAEIIPKNASGLEGGSFTTTPVLIENTVPSISSITISPSIPRVSTSPAVPMSLEEYTIADLDIIDGTQTDQSEIRWYESSDGVSFNEVADLFGQSQVPSSRFAVNRQWYCAVTPFDGLDKGVAVQSNKVSIES